MLLAMRCEILSAKLSIRRTVFVISAFFVSCLFFGASLMAFEIKTFAFSVGGEIPVQYSCDGADLSPPFEWVNVPEGTKSFALISDDPDAPMGTWVHWVVYDIPASVTRLKEGMKRSEVLSDGTKQGITDFGRPGYGGPCPPPGKPHRYYFKLYALDTLLNLPPRKTKADLLQIMQGHILAEAQVMGKYARKR